MQNSQALTQEQRLSLRLSQQQVRLVRLLELNAPELEEKVSQELESNPALEALPDSPPESQKNDDNDDWRDAHWRPASYASPRTSPDYPVAEENPSLYDHLHALIDVMGLPSDRRLAAEYIIGNLDSNGYLRTPLQQIALDIAVAEGTDIPDDVMREGLEIVRGLEPAGVGASDLRDSLLIQLNRLSPSPERENAILILSKKYEDFANRHLKQVAESLHLSEEQVRKASALIRQLNPKPGAQYESRAASASNFVSPDFILEEGPDGLQISLANRIPELSIQQSFQSAVDNIRRNTPRRERKGNEYIFSRVSDARDFIHLLSQRQQTLMKVASAILGFQKEYFETGDVYRMRPMMIKDLIPLTGLDASYISRATAGKYIQTPWGVFPMRFFFSDSIGNAAKNAGKAAGKESQNKGEQPEPASTHAEPTERPDGTTAKENATRQILEAEIRDIVDNEDKSDPLTDDQIQAEMLRRGYELSRRTVAKYRTRMRIPVGRLRRSY